MLRENGGTSGRVSDNLLCLESVWGRSKERLQHAGKAYLEPVSDSGCFPLDLSASSRDLSLSKRHQRYFPSAAMQIRVENRW
jgi:hypothetical protein